VELLLDDELLGELDELDDAELLDELLAELVELDDGDELLELNSERDDDVDELLAELVLDDDDCDDSDELELLLVSSTAMIRTSPDGNEIPMPATSVLKLNDAGASVTPPWQKSLMMN
jgi:hypothetical protein